MSVTQADLIESRFRLAGNLAISSGELVRTRFGQTVSSIKEDNSLVTDVDHAAQKHILDRVAKSFPEDAVITEEAVAEPERHAPLGSTEFTWVVDPIDGTRNYTRGFPVFSVSIAVFAGRQPVVGVICDPMTGMLYSAAKGKGARRNDQPISVGRAGRPGGILVALPSGDGAPIPANVLGWLEWIVLRNTGSTALHLALVAAGALDAAYSNECKIWDIAAGIVLVREAGGIVTLPDGSPLPDRPLSEYVGKTFPFLAATPEVHGRLAATFKPGADR